MHKSRSSLYLIAPVGDFFLADQHRGDRSSQKAANAIGNDAAQEPAEPKQHEGYSLAPGKNSNRREYGTGEKGQHRRYHRQQDKNQHAKHRKPGYQRLDPDDDLFGLVVQGIRGGNESGDDNDRADDEDVALQRVADGHRVVTVTWTWPGTRSAFAGSRTRRSTCCISSYFLIRIYIYLI